MDPARLAAIPFLSGLPPEELAAVARAAGELEVAPGDPLVIQGEFGHTVFVVEEGTADVSSEGVTIGSVGPGDVVGEIAVLASGRRTASIVATSPMRLITLFKRDVWSLDHTAPEAAERLRSVLSDHRKPAET